MDLDALEGVDDGVFRVHTTSAGLVLGRGGSGKGDRNGGRLGGDGEALRGALLAFRARLPHRRSLHEALRAVIKLLLGGLLWLWGKVVSGHLEGWACEVEQLDFDGFLEGGWGGGHGSIQFLDCDWRLKRFSDVFGFAQVDGRRLL